MYKDGGLIKYEDIKNPVQGRLSQHRFIPLHWHSYYEIELIVEGEVKHLVNGQSFDSRAGDISIMSPTDFHGYIPTGGHFTVKKFIFTQDLLKGEILRMLMNIDMPKVYRPDEKSRAELEPLFDRIIALSGVCSPTAFMKSGDFAEIVCLYLLEYADMKVEAKQLYGNAPENAEKTMRLSSALKYISEHFTERITLDDVAGRLGLGGNYFSRYFRDELGTSFSHYLKQKRVQYAASLLLSTDMTAELVAEGSGFTSVTFFNRAFRERHGMTPTEYRKCFGR